MQVLFYIEQLKFYKKNSTFNIDRYVFSLGERI